MVAGGRPRRLAMHRIRSQRVEVGGALMDVVQVAHSEVERLLARLAASRLASDRSRRQSHCRTGSSAGARMALA
jgi:hypothetical protein